MTISKILSVATKKLEQAGVGTARLDALILLEDVTGRNRSWLLANPRTVILPKRVAKLGKLLGRRAKHEPLSFIRGKSEFYGREFIINQNVLEPRPESETMIDLLKALPDLPSTVRLADVGAGSGALGITAALELPNSRVDLLEIDTKALKVAKTNVDKFTLNVKTIETDLLKASGCDYHILLCNLPYVPDDFKINLAATHEPKLAIFGGRDGLNVYRNLFLQLNTYVSKPLYILCESLPPHHTELAQVAKAAGYNQTKEVDFIQLFIYRK